MFKLTLLYQILIGYGVATLVVFFLSDNMMFQPPKSTYADNPQIIKLEPKNGKKIAAFYLVNPNAKYTILFSHGNAEDLGAIYSWMQEIAKWGFSVMAYDYQGYGISEGRPTENATYLDINAAYDYLLTERKIDPKHIIVFGRSIGTGPSIELASKKPIAGLILESAFVSAYRVITHVPVFLFDKYTNLNKINQIKVPILFIYGTEDTIIPPWHTQKLYSHFNGLKYLFVVEDAGHNDINYVAGSTYEHEVQKFAQSL